MFKKIRKLLQEDLTQRYQAFEDRYLRFESKMYKTLEDRLANLEQRFDDLADVLSGKKTSSKQSSNKKETAAKEETTETNTTETVDLTDLKLLKGLGTTLENKLKDAGLKNLKQMAALTEDQVAELDEKIPGFAVRFNRYDWSKQAADIVNA